MKVVYRQWLAAFVLFAMFICGLMASHSPRQIQQGQKEYEVSGKPVLSRSTSERGGTGAATDGSVYKPGDHPTDWLMVLLTAVLAIIGWRQAVIFERQRQIFNAQLDVFTKQAAWMEKASTDTEKAIEAAVKANEHANAANEISRNANMQAREDGMSAHMENMHANEIAREANIITRDALRSTERAFVFLERLDIVEANLKSYILIVPKWKNSGNTPTHHMYSRVSWYEYPDEILDTFPFNDVIRSSMPGSQLPVGVPMGSEIKRNLIGPGSTADGETIILSAETIIRACKGQTHIYIWGWADYNDVFSGEIKNRHRTEFCYKVVPLFVEGDIAEINQTYVGLLIKGGDISRRIAFELHHKHNGSDGECEGRLAPYTSPD
jgi:hypothetical protein